jgi:sigma-B regulation protein RsbU (phosphoserine phosphatase)
MKVLALEDQPLAAMQLAASLRSLGHEPDSVTSGAEAWAKLNREPFRVVVSDWRMAGMDGLDLCRLVRNRGGEYVYFILISAAGVTQSGREEALAAGVDDFLAKPIVPEELRMRLHVAERILRFTVQVQQLESFLPICSYCKKVRDDKKYWTQIESYLTQRDGTNFSHGVCPDCYIKVVVPELKGMGMEAPPPYPGQAP